MSSGGLFGYRGLGLYERLSHLTAPSADEPGGDIGEQVSDDASRKKNEVEETGPTKIHLNFMASDNLRTWTQTEDKPSSSRCEKQPLETAADVQETSIQADEELQGKLREEEAARLESRALAEEAIMAAEAARLAAAAKIAKEEQEEADRLAAEEQERLVAESVAKEEAEHLEQERLAREMRAKEEAARLASEEEERIRSEIAAEAEAERMTLELAAKEEAERLEKERQEAELRANAESDRLIAEINAKEEADRLAAEEEEHAKAAAERLSSELVAKEEADRVEKERQESEILAKLEVDMAEIAAKEESDRLAAEEEERRFAEVATQAEADRLSRELAAKEESERAEKDRLEAELRAKTEIDRLTTEISAKEEAEEEHKPIVAEAANQAEVEKSVVQLGAIEESERLEPGKIAEEKLAKPLIERLAAEQDQIGVQVQVDLLSSQLVAREETHDLEKVGSADLNLNTSASQCRQEEEEAQVLAGWQVSAAAAEAEAERTLVQDKIAAERLAVSKREEELAQLAAEAHMGTQSASITESARDLDEVVGEVQEIAISSGHLHTSVALVLEESFVATKTEVEKSMCVDIPIKEDEGKHEVWDAEALSSGEPAEHPAEETEEQANDVAQARVDYEQKLDEMAVEQVRSHSEEAEVVGTSDLVSCATEQLTGQTAKEKDDAKDHQLFAKMMRVARNVARDTAAEDKDIAGMDEIACIAEVEADAAKDKEIAHEMNITDVQAHSEHINTREETEVVRDNVELKIKEYEDDERNANEDTLVVLSGYHESDELTKHSDAEEYSLDELEEAATKASSADEAKSSTASEDGAEISEDMAPEFDHHVVDEHLPLADAAMPTYFYIGDTNCKVQNEVAPISLGEIAPHASEKRELAEIEPQHQVDPPLERKETKADFEENVSVAQWISARHVSWSVVETAPIGSQFFLCVSSAADAAITRHKLEIAQDTEPLRSQSRRVLLKVPEDVVAVAHQWCRHAISVCCEEPGAETTKVATVMIGGLLDDIFRFDDALGCHIAPTVDIGVEGFQFALWAPTALGVVLVLYDSFDGPISGEVPMVRDDDEKVRDEETQYDGVWRAWGPLLWRGKYYSYRVQVYCPLAKKSRCIDIPDPYASVCHPGAARSLVSCEVATLDADEHEPLTQSRLKPMLVHRAKATIFELSDRDICALDTSCSSSSHQGHIDLRRLADAGITHVHIRDAAAVEAENILQCKDLVTFLHAEGLRVVVDAPLTCTTAARSLAKCIPAYCLLDHDIAVSAALDYQMVEHLVVNRCVHWAIDLQVDGFCMDASQFTLKCVRSCRAALNALTLEKHGVDGPRILLCVKGAFPRHDRTGQGDVGHGHGLYCSGISCSNSKICDAIGSLFRNSENLDERSQSCGMLCHRLAAGLKEFRVHDNTHGAESLISSPDEVVNCVSSLESSLHESSTPVERLRLAWLGMGAVALAQGTPLLSFQDELLRLGALRSAEEGENSTCFERMYEFLNIRSSTPLFSLTDPRDILEKVTFPPVQEPGVIVMQTRNGPPARFSFVPELCDRFARIVIVLSVRRVEVRVPAPAFDRARSPLQLHPVQATSVDESTRNAFFDAEADELVVPPLSAIVFVEQRMGADANL